MTQICTRDQLLNALGYSEHFVRHWTDSLCAVEFLTSSKVGKVGSERHAQWGRCGCKDQGDKAENPWHPGLDDEDDSKLAPNLVEGPSTRLHVRNDLSVRVINVAILEEVIEPNLCPFGGDSLYEGVSSSIARIVFAV
ncbi:hypothetical protein H2202_004568 [Exophiala xenobiotica]|nr:hypothetical protein H2202_004568 [Exophiala xenobiotica]